MITIIQWKNNLESDVKINLKLSKLKPLHSDWLVKLYHEMQSKGELIRKGFDKAGITDALNMEAYGIFLKQKINIDHTWINVASSMIEIIGVDQYVCNIDHMST